MNKLELLKTKLQQARKELNDKGYHYDPEMYDKQGYDALMNIKPFEIKYQDVIEEIWPDEAWWKVTNYWDIFDAMAFGGLNDETVIDEICNHVDRAFLDEACKIEESLDKELKELETKYGCKFEEGHTHAEYEDEFGDEYENGELWDYSIDDIKSGAVEPQKGLVYWLIYDKDDELRVFETLRTINESKELKEGTSNFGWLRKFPLLVFYTWDEIDGKMRYAQGYPEIEQFTTDKGNGDFHVDYDAYYDALDKFEQKYWDSVDTCVLNEDDIESLEDAIYNFNEETEQIANDLWDAGNEDDYYVLKNIKLKVEPGYYEAAYIDVDDEKEFDYLSDKIKEEQLKRFNDFFDTLKKDFGLSHYKVAWGPASNDETGYKKVESLKESKELKLSDVKEGQTFKVLGDVVYCDITEEGMFEDDEELIKEFTDNGFKLKGTELIIPANTVLRYDMSQSVDVYSIAKTDYQFEVGEWSEEALNTKVEIITTESKKKDCHVNTNAGDPVKNAEFFNASMGTSSEGGTVGEDLKEELKDEEIFDILGIEEDNRESSDYLLSQFRELAKKHDKNKIYLKGDIGISVKGNVIDSTEDLAVVDESLKEDLKVSTDDTTIHVDSLDAVTAVQSDEGTVVVQSNGDVTVHTDDVVISKEGAEVKVDVNSDVAIEEPVIADVSPEAEATAELIAEPVEAPVVDDATVSTSEDVPAEIETQESLKEGYIGQTVEDFLDLVVDPEVIETLVISDIDAEDYDENFNGTYDELDDSIKESDYADFDVGGNTLVINASEDEDDAGDFYQTVEDLLEDYNGDMIEVQVDGETKFSGDKSDIEEDVAQLTLVSIDAPKYLCINAHLGGHQLGIGDIEDIIDDAKDDFHFELEGLKEENKLNEEPVYNLDTRYDTRDSFYGKAKVDVRGDGSQILYSYGTPVCIITKDGDVKLLRKGYLGWFSSQTTLRHVKEFLKQNGKEIGTKNELNKMYPTEDAYDYVR